jgi:hypothetical protein
MRKVIQQPDAVGSNIDDGATGRPKRRWSPKRPWRTLATANSSA